MSAIQTVVYDFGALSLLMLIGYFIRKKSRLLQDLYLPAALVAGPGRAFSHARLRLPQSHCPLQYKAV